MADRKISDLTALTTPASGDYLPIVDISETAASSKNKRITIEELFRGVPLGTAAAPSIAIEGDEDTGIYSPGANQVAISTNGTGRLFVDSSGNVGINNASPSSYLSGSEDLVIGEGSAAAGLTIRSGTSSDGFFAFADGTTGDEAYRGYIAYGHLTDHLRFATSGTERLRITSDGKVGLGTSLPDTALHLASTSPVFRFENPTTTSTTGTSMGKIEWETRDASAPGVIGYIDVVDSNNFGTAFDMQLATGVSGAATTKVTIKADGNVGVGTTSPGALVHVYGSNSGATASGTLVVEQGSAPSIQILSANSQTQELRFGDPQDNDIGKIQYSHVDDSLRFIANANECARIDSSGRLLVGTSSDSGGALLQVNDNRIRIATAKTPASASDTGTTGEVCWDASYIYVCTATDTWKRAALSTW